MTDYIIYAAYFAVGFFVWWGFINWAFSLVVGCEYTTPMLGLMILGMSTVGLLGYSAVLLGNPLFFVATGVGGFFGSLFDGAYNDWKKWKMKKEQDEGAQAGLSKS